MTSRFTTLSAMLIATVLAVVGGRVCCAQGQNFELQELKTTLEASARQIGELQAQLAAQKAQAQTLTQSLASANSDSTAARESLEKLRGLLEGLGVGSLEGNTNQVQERLLSALSDLRILDEQKKRLSEALMNLSEASLAYAKLTPSADAEASAKLNESISTAERVIRTAATAGSGLETPSTDLHSAKVVSVKDEAGVVVLNVGARDGVRVGMPFSVYHGEEPVARVLVVDVRKSVAGAVIQQVIGKATVKAGDSGVIDTDRSF